MLTIQKIEEGERIPEITRLLNQAYKPLADMGLNYTAARQTEQVTAERMAGAHTFGAFMGEQIVGVITAHTDEDQLFYRQPDTFVIGPFGVLPDQQNTGIGSQLLRFVEAQAFASTYALDTAIPATNLTRYYQKHGYRELGQIKWGSKNYASALMAKALDGSPYLIHPAEKQHEDGFADVVQEVYREYGFTYDPDGYHKDLFDLHGYYSDGFWVATDASGRVLGGAGLKRDGDDFEVARMYVRPSARRLGIGSRLMKILISEAQFQGRKELNIWTDVAFNDAHRLYQKFGATTVSERICPGDPDAACEHGMILQLDCPAAQQTFLTTTNHN